MLQCEANVGSGTLGRLRRCRGRDSGSIDELMERLHAQAEMPPAQHRICRGRLLSPRDYVVDIAEWGFGDVVGKGIEEKHERHT